MYICIYIIYCKKYNASNRHRKLTDNQNNLNDQLFSLKTKAYYLQL